MKFEMGDSVIITSSLWELLGHRNYRLAHIIRDVTENDVYDGWRSYEVEIDPHTSGAYKKTVLGYQLLKVGSNKTPRHLERLAKK